MPIRTLLIGGMSLLLLGLEACPVRGQSSQADSPVEAPKPPLRPSGSRLLGAGLSIALIDMGYVFKNSKRFNTQRKELEEELARFTRQDQKRAAHIKALQESVKSAEAGSEEQQSLNLELIKRTADYQALQVTKKQGFAKREAEIFKSLYLDVQSLVETFAREQDIALVIRFERGQISEIEDAAESLKRMNRQIVHYDPALDISDEILRRLNRLHALQEKESTGLPRRSRDDHIH